MKQTISKAFKTLFPYSVISGLWKRLIVYLKEGRDIGWQNAYRDIFSVIRKLWFFSLFQIIVVVAFIFLAQGQDILQSALEDFYARRYAPFYCIIVASWFWSLASEFGARMLLNLTDNKSNLKKTDKRWDFRKKTQKLIPAIQAIFPFLVFIVGFIITFSHHHQKNTPLDLDLFFLLFILALLLNLSLALSFYFEENWLHNKYFNRCTAFETYMTSTLGNILDNDEEISEYLEKYPNDLEQIKKYRNPDTNALNFQSAYPFFFKRSLSFFGIALSLFLLMGFFFRPVVFYWMGTPSIIVMGITTWLILFYSIKIFEITAPFKGKFKFLNLPYSTFLFIWFLFCSYINNDHPININEDKCCNTKPEYLPKDYLAHWLPLHKVNTVNAETKIFNPIKLEKQKKYIVEVPLIFICAEGGALRTGCFTSLLLAAIQDAYPDFKDRIFAYSTVSGGTFGANLFNASTFVPYQKTQDSLRQNFVRYYKDVDFLAPIAAKLLFGDFINYFIPFYIKGLDRQVALEESWENSWTDYFGTAENNFLNKNFYEATATDGSRPLVLINTTVLERGNRGILSNAKIDTTYFREVFDLNKAINFNFTYSTGIGLSARFPIISPAGKLDIDKQHKVHIADGGYFENLGNTTMLELLNSLAFDSIKDSIKIVPMLLQTVFDSEKQREDRGISFLNELSEFCYGLYNARTGHGAYANGMLKKKIKEMGGIYMELPVSKSSEEVPMNWVLSAYAIDNANSRVLSLLNKKIPKESEDLYTFLKRSGVMR